MTPPEIELIHADQQQWVYGENYTPNELPTKDFMVWYEWAKRNLPLENQPLEDFDIKSVLELFCEWVMKPLE